jgi:Membrane-associated phospholipid phosphatase
MWYNAPFNAAIIKFIQSFASPFLDKFFSLATMMGEESFFMVAAVLIFWCINKEFGYRLGFAYLSNGVINSGVKEVFKVPRPIGEPGIRSLRLETAGGYSFPSGHSQCSASFWTSVMVKVKKTWVYIVGTILILLVMVSRLYLGVHRPVDVLIGAAIGAVWVFVSNLMFDISEKTGNKAVFLIFIIPMLILLFILPNADFYKAAGVALAFYVGYIIEPKYIKYDVRASLPVQALKFIIGFAVMMGIRLLLKPILPAAILSDLFRYFLMGIWATIGAPYVFKKLFVGTHTASNEITVSK